MEPVILKQNCIWKEHVFLDLFVSCSTASLLIFPKQSDKSLRAIFPESKQCLQRWDCDNCSFVKMNCVVFYDIWEKAKLHNSFHSPFLFHGTHTYCWNGIIDFHMFNLFSWIVEYNLFCHYDLFYKSLIIC